MGLKVLLLKNSVMLKVYNFVIVLVVGLMFLNFIVNVSSVRGSI